MSFIDEVLEPSAIGHGDLVLQNGQWVEVDTRHTFPSYTYMNRLTDVVTPCLRIAKPLLDALKQGRPYR